MLLRIETDFYLLLLPIAVRRLGNDTYKPEQTI